MKRNRTVWALAATLAGWALIIGFRRARRRRSALFNPAWPEPSNPTPVSAAPEAPTDSIPPPIPELGNEPGYEPAVAKEPQ